MERVHRRTIQKNILMTPNYNGVVSHSEPDILECEVKWVLKSAAAIKLVEEIEFQQSYLKS